MRPGINAGESYVREVAAFFLVSTTIRTALRTPPAEAMYLQVLAHLSRSPPPVFSRRRGFKDRWDNLKLRVSEIIKKKHTSR